MFSAVSRGINVALVTKPKIISFLDIFRIFSRNIGSFAPVHTTGSVNFGSSFLVMVILYWIIPYRWLSCRIVIPAAFFTAIFQVAGKSIFMYYLNTTADFKAVYGSLSSIVVLLLWLYYSAYMIIYGAELMSVYLTKRTD